MKLEMQLGEILALLDDAATSVDASFPVNSLASLEKAGPHDLAVVLDRGDQSVFDAVSTSRIGASQAGVILANAPIVPGKNYILVPDPLQAYSKLVAHVTEFADQVGFVASSAIVHPTATVGQGVTIEDGVIVCKNAILGNNIILKAGSFVGVGAVIGDHTVAYQGVKILDGCIVGKHSIIHAGTVIGSDGFGYQVTSSGLRKVPQIGIVKIGNHVEIGANCTIDRASFDATVIEDYVKIDNLVHVAHNVTIGAGTAILALTGIAGSAKIGRGCQIGGQVGIKNDVVIGSGVKIVSLSGVMNSLADGETVAGIPARSFSQWKRSTVVFEKLPELAKTVSKLSGFTEALMKKDSWIRKISKLFGRD